MGQYSIFGKTEMTRQLNSVHKINSLNGVFQIFPDVNKLVNQKMSHTGQRVSSTYYN